MKQYFVIFLFLCCATSFAQHNEWRDLLDKRQYKEIITQAVDLQAADSVDFTKMYYLGQAYEGLLKYTDAYNCYKQCYTIDSTRTDMLNTLARICGNSGRVKEAVKYYLQVKSYDNTNFFANYQLARSYAQLGNNTEGMKYIDFLLESDPENTVLLRSKGDFYLNMDSLILASEYYNKAFYRNIENASLASTLVNLLLKLDSPDNKYFNMAYSVCDTALFYNPEDKSLLQNKAMMHYMLTDFEIADKIFTSLMTSGDSSKITLKYCGLSRFYAKDWYGALEPLEKVFEKEQNADVCMLIGLCIGRTYSAKESFKFFDMSEVLMSPDVYWTNMLLQSRAEMSVKIGDCQKAAEYYLELSKKEDLKFSMLSSLYLCYYRTGFDKMSDADKERFLYICFWYATEALKSIEESKRPNEFNMSSLRSSLSRFQEEMFFRVMKEYPMVSPDNKRNTLSAEKIKELIDKLSNKRETVES